MSSSITYPSMRRRMFGFAITSSMQYSGTLATVGLLAALTKQTVTFTSVFQTVLLVAAIAVATYFIYKIGTKGMTLRHFIFGYQVVNREDGSYPTLFKLYVREVVAYAAGCVWIMKMLLPILFKATSQAMDGKNDHHVVYAKNDGVYVSNKSIGQMRAEEGYHESKAQTEAEMYRLSQEGFFHDNMFGTCAIDASRSEVLATFKKSATPPPVPLDSKKAA